MLEQKTIDELKTRLLEEKVKLEGELGRIAEFTGTEGNYEARFENIGTDPDENASEVEEYADKLAVEQDLEKRLKDTNDALKRMEDGTYGFCEKCNKEIPVERLQAYPAARDCVKC